MAMNTETSSCLNTVLPRILKIPRSSERGLTLVESVVSLLIFFVALAGIVPIFLNYTISTINNEKRTAAIAVSQQVLDGLRQSDIETLPESGTVTLANVPYMGKTYTPTVTYCQNQTYCDVEKKSRHIILQVSHNGNPVYEAETVFTKFE